MISASLAYYALISLIVGAILLVILAFFKSDPGPNRYGKRTNAPAECLSAGRVSSHALPHA